MYLNRDDKIGMMVECERCHKQEILYFIRSEDGESISHKPYTNQPMFEGESEKAEEEWFEGKIPDGHVRMYDVRLCPDCKKKLQDLINTEFWNTKKIEEADVWQ